MFFWNSLAFSMIQRMLAIWSLVPLPFTTYQILNKRLCLAPQHWRFWHYHTNSYLGVIFENKLQSDMEIPSLTSKYCILYVKAMPTIPPRKTSLVPILWLKLHKSEATRLTAGQEPQHTWNIKWKRFHQNL